MRSKSASGAASESAPSVQKALQHQYSGQGSPSREEPDSFTDWNVNHTWLVGSSKRLFAAYQNLPDGDSKGAVAALLHDEQQLDLENAEQYQTASSAHITLEPWVREDLKFGSVTAERFAAVAIEQTLGLFENSRPTPDGKLNKDFSDRVEANSQLLVRLGAEAKSLSAHPDAVAACHYNLNALQKNIQRARTLLTEAVKTGESTENFIFLNHSEMLTESLQARFTCYAGWEAQVSGSATIRQ